jgi:threonine/homoserine/homoserine lactone efflux protein
MNLQLYAVYLTALTVGMLTPGPAMLQALSLGLRHGTRPVAVVALGNLCVSMLQVALVLSGLSLLADRPEVLRLAGLAGAAYLGFLGWKLWRAPAPSGPAARCGSEAVRPGGLFVQGALVAAVNPKAWASLAALLPRFAAAGPPDAAALAAVAAPIAVLAFGGMMAYAGCGSLLGRLLASSRARGRFFRSVAVVLWLCAGYFAAW